MQMCLYQPGWVLYIHLMFSPVLLYLYVLGVCKYLNMRRSHDPSATVQMLFAINITALLYYYLRSCRTDPGIVKATEEEKKKVRRWM